MHRSSALPRGLLLVLVAAVALLAAGCQHIHDPWARPGTMKTQLEVGASQQAQLQKRQLYGQSDR